MTICSIEYGPIVLDFALRFRVHALMQAVGKPSNRSARRHHRSHARHPLAANSLRPAPARARRSDRRAPVDRGRARRPVRHGGAVAHRASAAVVERRSGAARRSTNTCSGVRADAPWCPSNIEFIRRINGLDIDRRREAHRLRRDLSRARSRRRLSRRAGRDAGRSASPPRHHEIQSGAHLDAGQRRRHRRRLSLHLRHGGAGRLSALRAHVPDVEHLPRDRARSSPASRGCCASSIRSGSSPSRARSFATFATGFSRANATSRSIPARFRVRDYLAFVDANAEKIAAFKTRQQAAFDAERARWQMTPEDGQWRWRRRCRRLRSRRRCCRQAQPPIESPVPGSVWKILVEPGRDVAEGETLIIVESMKMEIAVCAPSSGMRARGALRRGAVGAARPGAGHHGETLHDASRSTSPVSSASTPKARRRRR